MFKFTIPLVPKGQKRFKINARGANVRTYKDPAQVAHERDVLAYLAAYVPAEPIRGPVLFGLKAYFEPAASWSARKTADALEGRMLHTSRPDLSNIIKGIEDCANGRFYLDDSQIVRYTADTGKYYGYPARYEIEIIPL